MLIAEIKPTTGRQVAPNQILFEDCFDDVRADVRFTYERGGFHQDVILRQKLSPLWLEKNGFNADTTRLEIWTEFFEAPEPQIQSRGLERVEDATLRGLLTQPDIVEEELDFGSMKIPVGRAYSPQTSDGSIRRAIPVPKQWLEIGARRFLVESLDLAALEPLLSSLPPCNRPEKRDHPLYAQRRPPCPVLRSPGTNQVLLAGVKPQAPGVVLDYQTVISTTNLVLAADTTYYVNGAVSVYGDFTIEGGLAPFTSSAASPAKCRLGLRVSDSRGQTGEGTEPHSTRRSGCRPCHRCDYRCPQRDRTPIPRAVVEQLVAAMRRDAVHGSSAPGRGARSRALDRRGQGFA